MEAGPIYKSTSCARLHTTKISMVSNWGKSRVNPLISLWTELNGAGFGKIEAGPIYKSTSCARLCTTKLSIASSRGKWRVNPLISLWTELNGAVFGKMEAGPLYKSTSCARLRTTKLSMDSYWGKWKVNPLISLWMDLVLEKWRLVHYVKVLVAQGCAPPNSAWPQVRVNEGSINWFHCGWSWTLTLDWAWKTTPKWPLICCNASSCCKVMGRSSSMSADLYSDLAYGLGMKNYPKLTPHLLKYLHWLWSSGEVFFLISWFVHWHHHWTLHEKLPQIDT